MTYVIRGTQDDERLYWSDVWGWTSDADEATKYPETHDRWKLIPAIGAKDVAWEKVSGWTLEDHDLHGELD